MYAILHLSTTHSGRKKNFLSMVGSIVWKVAGSKIQTVVLHHVVYKPIAGEVAGRPAKNW